MADVKNKRGGARPGSGRKKMEHRDKYVSKSLALKHSDWEIIDRIVLEKGITRNKFISEIVLNYLNTLK